MIAGPCGYTRESPLAPLPRIEVTAVDGAHIKTLDAVFAEAWDFPQWFGRNANAFDDLCATWTAWWVPAPERSKAISGSN
ncbi:barstar family protein [Mycobacterium sp. Aquia_216]|uniref:barstar family protein n=1 Tax=Mycobacterium sp. Aquia_216 TaxID=2991729 RepID=UPI003FA36E6E